MLTRASVSSLGVIGVLALAGAATAEDWPAYRRDAGRSAATADRVELPLRAAWVRRSPQAPAPAWSEPGRVINVMDFDYAFQPVVAEGVAVFGSSADDTVRALELATGRPMWAFTAGGAVRFAPHLDKGKCYFASDDGFVRCLDLRTGAEVWSVRASATDRTLVANGRLASRRPCRSGVLVRDGVVYATAGMWPSEGVFVYALDAATGRELWCNDTGGYDYLAYPHEPSASFGGPAPQGYLLTDGRTLAVPTGRSCPAAFDANSGKLLHYRSELAARGGTWATLMGGTILFSAVGWQPDQSFRLGESDEHSADSLSAMDLRTGEEKWEAGAAMKAAADEWKRPRWRGQINFGLMGRRHAIAAGNRLYAMGAGKVDAYEVEGPRVRKLWSVEHGAVCSEALAGDVLLLGGRGSLSALSAADGRQLWSTPLDGQVRGLAVADGRVLASTDRGTIVCLVPGKTGEPTDVSPAITGSTPAAPAALRQVTGAAQTGGFAVVVASDARTAQAIAAHSRLQVVCVLGEESAVRAERKRLIAETALYGSRVTVHVMSRDAAGSPRLPVPGYLANLVFVERDAGVAGAELYRVLRPISGVMSFADRATADRLVGSTGAAAGEVRRTDGETTVVRGKLAGAFDWDSRAEADERVRWPLEFQWFGEPGGELLVSRHSRPRTPLAAGGRLFVFGESHLTAVDAYNGRELWRRRLSTEVCTRETDVTGDDESLYIHDRAGVIRLDAQTGRVTGVFAGDKPSAAPPVYDARKPIRIAGPVRKGASGAIEVRSDDTHLTIDLTTDSVETSRDDAWELALDFRPPARRLDAPGPGTFELVVNPFTGARRARPTFDHAPVAVAAQRRPTGATVTLTLAWADIVKSIGRRPDDFALAADLKLWTDDMRLRLWSRPLTEGRARGLNEAEAVFRVAESNAPAIAGAVAPHWPAPIGAPADLPPHARRAGRLPPSVRKRADGDFSADFKDAGKSDDPAGKDKPLLRAKGFEFPLREQPLTGITVPRDYTRSYGCSGTSTSATMDFFRSGTIGMYDRLDDSGMRNLSGIRSGCGLSLIPAFGMLLYSDSTADCTCAYSFATSLGLVPATERLNEDWALFDDHHLTAGLIRRTALNIGAAGDRRDNDGILWLGFPRPPLALARKTANALRLPYEIEFADASGTFRTNTDRRPIAGTDKPWVYGSGVRGVTRVSMDLVHHHPLRSVLSVGSRGAPKIDADLSDACWDGFAPLAMPDDGKVWLRHDADHLYAAFERPAASKLKVGPRRVPMTQRDGDFERDDHFRLSLRGRGRPEILTFAIAAGQGVYDARLSALIDVPPAVAGKPDVATVLDLGGATARLSWSDAGLNIRCEAPTDFAGGESATTAAFVFVSGDRSREVAFEPATGTVRTKACKGAVAEPTTFAATARKADGRSTMECTVPWADVGAEGKPGDTALLFVRLGKPEDRPGAEVLSALRKKAGRVETAFRLRVADAASAPVKSARNRLAAGTFELVPVLRDDPSWNGAWTAAVKRDPVRTRAEMAIPWKTLADRGITPDQLLAEVAKVGRWVGQQDRLFAAFDESAAEVRSLDQPPPSAKFLVRLHFAEPDDVQPGERVFDVRLNGKTVLENLDVVREAGGRMRPLVREFDGIDADARLEVTLIPKSARVTDRTAPILSGLEAIRR